MELGCFFQCSSGTTDVMLLSLEPVAVILSQSDRLH